ncbi:hypothetical protein H0H92_001810 [Tricholoma furcatifolium]|nr:hypothetical protein H0H92_001810 [Tricholoma furcatifolium]
MNPQQTTANTTEVKKYTGGRRLLALDGGGIRGLSSLFILDEIMFRIQHRDGLENIPKPCEYFDLIGGTNSGGINAILLGRLCLSVQDAIEGYMFIAKKAFSEKNLDGTYKEGNLEAAIQEVALKYEKSKNALMKKIETTPESSDCKVQVLLPPNASNARLFRSYPVIKNPEYNAKIWEAVRATFATPKFFGRISIGTEPKEEFVDGGFRVNNPVFEVLQEAKLLWGNERIKCIVNIGTGYPKTIKIPLKATPLDCLMDIAMDCEATAERFASNHIDRGVYYRLNVDHGIEEVGLDEWKKLSEVKTHAKAYLHKNEVGRKVDEVTGLLSNRGEKASQPPEYSEGVVAI